MIFKEIVYTIDLVSLLSMLSLSTLSLRLVIALATTD